MVVLPEPLSPISAKNSPRATRKLTSSTILSSLAVLTKEQAQVLGFEHDVRSQGSYEVQVRFRVELIAQPVAQKVRAR